MALYSFPELYDAAVRDAAAPEMDRLVSIFKLFGNAQVQSLVEPACGTGAYLFAARKLGFQVWGYDLSSEMVEFCAEKIRQKGWNDTAAVVHGNLASPPTMRSDCAYLLADALSYLDSENALVNHFQKTLSQIEPSGIYVVECLHLSAQTAEFPVFTWTSVTDERRYHCQWKVLGINSSLSRYCSELSIVRDDELVLSEQEESSYWSLEVLSKCTEAAGGRTLAILDSNLERVNNRPEVSGLYYFVCAPLHLDSSFSKDSTQPLIANLSE